MVAIAAFVDVGIGHRSHWPVTSVEKQHARAFYGHSRKNRYFHLMIYGVNFAGRRFTDGDLVRLSGLENPKISDSGLIRLTRLLKLRYLGLKGTLATDNGIEELKTALLAADSMTRASGQTFSRDQIGYFTEADGRMHPWMRDKPDSLELLNSDPTAIEKDLLHRRWLVLHPGGAYAAFADGRVRFLSEKIDPKVLQALTTATSGENMPDDGW